MTHTPTQELILELLAARHRLGEHIWTFDSNGPTVKALRGLESAGLANWKKGVNQGTCLAWLTDTGKAEYMKPGYVAPSLKVHKATPHYDEHYDEQPLDHCEVCGQRIKRVPGGHGSTWVHSDTGCVAAPNPPKLIQALTP